MNKIMSEIQTQITISFRWDDHNKNIVCDMRELTYSDDPNPNCVEAVEDVFDILEKIMDFGEHVYLRTRDDFKESINTLVEEIREMEEVDHD